MERGSTGFQTDKSLRLSVVFQSLFTGHFHHLSHVVTWVQSVNRLKDKKFLSDNFRNLENSSGMEAS